MARPIAIVYDGPMVVGYDGFEPPERAPKPVRGRRGRRRSGRQTIATVGVAAQRSRRWFPTLGRCILAAETVRLRPASTRRRSSRASHHERQRHAPVETSSRRQSNSNSTARSISKVGHHLLRQELEGLRAALDGKSGRIREEDEAFKAVGLLYLLDVFDHHFRCTDEVNISR